MNSEKHNEKFRSLGYIIITGLNKWTQSESRKLIYRQIKGKWEMEVATNFKIQVVGGGGRRGKKNDWGNRRSHDQAALFPSCGVCIHVHPTSNLLMLCIRGWAGWVLKAMFPSIHSVMDTGGCGCSKHAGLILGKWLRVGTELLRLEGRYIHTAWDLPTWNLLHI